MVPRWDQFEFAERNDCVLDAVQDHRCQFLVLLGQIFIQIFGAPEKTVKFRERGRQITHERNGKIGTRSSSSNETTRF